MPSGLLLGPFSRLISSSRFAPFTNVIFVAFGLCLFLMALCCLLGHRGYTNPPSRSGVSGSHPNFVSHSDIFLGALFGSPYVVVVPSISILLLAISIVSIALFGPFVCVFRPFAASIMYSGILSSIFL